MTDKCKVDGCQMDQTGVCAMHGIEVERRESMKEIVDQIPRVLTKQNWILGVLSVFLILIIGGYKYTSDTRKELREDMKEENQIQQNSDLEFRRNLNNTRDAIGDLAIVTASQGALQTTILAELNEVTESLKIMAKDQIDHKEEINQKFNSWGDRVNGNTNH